MPQPPYTLVEHDLYRESAGKLGDVERVDEALRAMHWQISRNPTLNEKLPGRNVYVIRASDLRIPSCDTPVMVSIYYRIADKSHVEMLYVEAFPEEDDFF
jgi:hypothetical protein